MLATIALSSGAIADLSHGPVAYQKKYHREFAELLTKHGVLVFGSDDQRRVFIDSVRSGDGIPAVSRQAWNIVITEFAKKNRLSIVNPPDVPELSSLTSLSDLYMQWKEKVEVAVVREELSPAMRLDEQESGVLEGSVLEIATSMTVSEGRVIRNLEELVRSGKLKHNESRDTFWDSVLAPLAACTRNVVITDRFFFERMWDDADQDRYRDEPEHVCWLLNRLDASLLPQASVKIVAQLRRDDKWKTRWSTQETARMIEENWKRSVPRNIDRLEIVLAEPRGDRPHDRHIRFGDIGAIDINAGFDRLCEPTVRQKEGMKWSYGYLPSTLRDYKHAAQWMEAKPSYKAFVVS